MFEYPLFLIAAAVGALVPLLLHLLRSRKVVTLPFPTIRFLQMAQRAAARRLRLEHWLLWLLRTLIMVLIGLAFATPVLRVQGIQFLGRAPRDIAIVIDDSYSMGYETGRETIWEQAVATATELIDGLGENDRFTLVLARREPQVLIAEPVMDKEDGRAVLQSLTLGYGTSRLGPAIAAAYETLRDPAGRRLRELHILTDNQALAWEGVDALGDGDGAWSVLREDDDTSVYVSLLGVRAPENVTPVDIMLSPAVQRAGGGGHVTVALAHNGNPRETTVSLFVAEEERARRSVMTGTPQAGRLELVIPPLPGGTHPARVEVPADNLPVDDAFHFLVRVRDDVPVLVVGGEDDTFFLRAALRAAGAGTALTVLARDELPGHVLTPYAAIFLCNALPLAGQEIEVLERYAQRGGLLVIFPGSRAGPTDYQAWRQLPGLPGAPEELPRTQQRRTLTWVRRMHPVLRNVADAVASPVIAKQRRLTWTDWAEEHVPIIMSGEDQPFLVERPHGRGRVVMFSVSADRSWSNFPLTPIYLPLIAQLVEYGASMEAGAPYEWARRAFPLSDWLPDAEPDTRLVGPDNIPIPIRQIREEGQVILTVDNLTRPGIYSVDGPDGRQPVVAINLPREESNLTPIEVAELRERLALTNLYFAESPDELATVLDAHRVGRTYDEPLLWFLAALIPLEFIYANRLARARGRAAGTVPVDLSGHVKRHSGGAPA